MARTQIAQIEFLDQSSQTPAIAIISVIDTQVAITISRRNDGDIEAFLTPADAVRLSAALETAVQAVTSKPTAANR